MITSKDTVYISGPMTGMPDLNIPLFIAVGMLLRSRYGCGVINPAKQPLRSSWEEYMRYDVDRLRYATVLLQLPGWQGSRGAAIEFNLALMHGVLIVELLSIISPTANPVKMLGQKARQLEVSPSGGIEMIKTMVPVVRIGAFNGDVNHIRGRNLA